MHEKNILNQTDNEYKFTITTAENEKYLWFRFFSDYSRFFEFSNTSQSNFDIITQIRIQNLTTKVWNTVVDDEHDIHHIPEIYAKTVLKISPNTQYSIKIIMENNSIDDIPFYIDTLTICSLLEGKDNFTLDYDSANDEEFLSSGTMNPDYTPEEYLNDEFMGGKEDLNFNAYVRVLNL